MRVLCATDTVLTLVSQFHGTSPSSRRTNGRGVVKFRRQDFQFCSDREQIWYAVHSTNPWRTEYIYDCLIDNGGRMSSIHCICFTLHVKETVANRLTRPLSYCIVSSPLSNVGGPIDPSFPTMVPFPRSILGIHPFSSAADHSSD